ncbi:hypothetical protein Tco_0047219 [Tanacetum coccineum]
MTEGNQDGVQSYDTREGEGEEKKQHTPLKNVISYFYYTGGLLVSGVMKRLYAMSVLRETKRKVGMNVVEDPVIDEKNEDAALISPAMAEEEVKSNKKAEGRRKRKLTDGGATTPTGLISTSITHALHRLECKGKQEVVSILNLLPLPFGTFTVYATFELSYLSALAF